MSIQQLEPTTDAASTAGHELLRRQYGLSDHYLARLVLAGFQAAEVYAALERTTVPPIYLEHYGCRQLAAAMFAVCFCQGLLTGAHDLNGVTPVRTY